MQRTLTLVLTRKNWIPGNVEANFKKVMRFIDRNTAVKELKALADNEFEPLGVRDGNQWLWQA